MSKYIKVSDIYECEKIDLACELYYICELGKYLYYNYNKPLSLKGVLLCNVLTKSDIWVYFCIAQQSGWIVNASVPSEWLVDLDSFTTKDWKHYSLVLKNVLYTTEKVPFNKEDNHNRRRKDEWVIDGKLYSKFSYDLLTPQVLQICFSNVSSHNRLVFALDGKYSNKGQDNTINGLSINGALPQFSWLSLIAYVAIKKFMEYKTELLPLSLYLYFNNTLTLNEMSLSYFLILYDKSNCFKGWVFYTMDETVPQNTVNHLGYVAWYKEGLDKGLLSANEWYDHKTKLAAMQQLDIELNDVVLLFERKELQKMNHIKEIIDMNIAIVEKVTKHHIYLNVITTKNLKHEAMLDFNKLDQNIQKMYTKPPYVELKHHIKKFEWFELGVKYAMVDERYFILPLEECWGYKEQHVTNGYETLLVTLDQEDFIYWLLEDYGVVYNKVHFLEKYFKDRIPLYQSYIVDKQPMPDCFIK